MSEPRRFVDDPEQVADQLCQATLALEGIDYNAVVTADDLLTILEAKVTLGRICRRYRRHQHAERGRKASTGDSSGTDSRSAEAAGDAANGVRF